MVRLTFLCILSQLLTFHHRFQFFGIQWKISHKLEISPFLGEVDGKISFNYGLGLWHYGTVFRRQGSVTIHNSYTTVKELFRSLQLISLVVLKRKDQSFIETTSVRIRMPTDWPFYGCRGSHASATRLAGRLMCQKSPRCQQHGKIMAGSGGKSDSWRCGDFKSLSDCGWVAIGWKTGRKLVACRFIRTFLVTTLFQLNLCIPIHAEYLSIYASTWIQATEIVLGWRRRIPIQIRTKRKRGMLFTRLATLSSSHLGHWNQTVSTASVAPLCIYESGKGFQYGLGNSFVCMMHPAMPLFSRLRPLFVA